MPLAEELLQLETIVQILGQLARESQAADFFQVLEEGDYYMLLNSIISSLLEELEPVIERTVLIEGQEDFPEHVDFQLVFEIGHSILLLLPGGHETPQRVLQ